MANTNSVKKMRENYRNAFVLGLREKLAENCDDVMVIASNTLAFPIVLEDGETEDFIKVVVSIPTGTKDEPFDGYALARDYAQKLENDKLKAEEKAKAKAEKIERDKKLREKKKAIHEGNA